MSSVHEDYPSKPTNTNPPVGRTQSPMSSTTMHTSAPCVYGTSDALAHSYIEAAPGSRYLPPPDSRPSNLRLQHGSQLPPPESLLAGVPSSAGSSSPDLHSPSPTTASYPARFIPSASARAQPPCPSALHNYSKVDFENNQTGRRLQQSENTPSGSLRGIEDDIAGLPSSGQPRHLEGRGLAQQRPPFSRPLQRPLEPYPGPEPIARLPRGMPLMSSTQPPQVGTGPGMAAIPNLLGPNRAHALSSISFRLVMRQQPQAARACGFGDRDRRVIDPPPIVELVIESAVLTRDEIQLYLRYESYVMNCSICDESGTRDASNMPEEYQHQRRLMGSLVGTPFVGQDDHGKEGCFFCFSDLSCRTPGAFRLKFNLIMIDPTRASAVRRFPILTEIQSGVFHVYSAKEFPGMMASSDLAKRLKEQGCIISIKKGNERSRTARGQQGASDNDD